MPNVPNSSSAQASGGRGEAGSVGARGNPDPGSQSDDEVDSPLDEGRSAAILPVPACAWTAIGASVRGTSHEKTGTVCQDSFEFEGLSSGILVAAVSDGAGTASHAELGSSVAARAAVASLKRHWLESPPQAEQEWEAAIRRSLSDACDAVIAEAESQGVPSRDLAATLIVIVAAPAMTAAGQIGDGASMISDGDGAMELLTRPQSGEFLNETIFLIALGALEQAQIIVRPGRAAFLAAFTDGLQMLALRMSDGAPHPPFFTPLFRFLREQPDPESAAVQLRAFLKSPRITDRADDDLTLLLAHLPA